MSRIRPETAAAVLAAVVATAFGLVSLPEAWAAIARGAEVYLFLLGMMLLADLLRVTGVFDTLAVHALSAARGSRLALLTSIYLVGVVVTALFSNDATAVVLAPAVAAVLARTDAEPLPYLYACAFVANAASFVLPFSNPANLVVYGERLPRLGDWLATYALPSLLAIVLTFLVLVLLWRRSFAQPLSAEIVEEELTLAGRVCAVLASVGAAVILVAAVCGFPLGTATIAAALMMLLGVSAAAPQRAVEAVRGIAWQVVPMVAGLFVVVAALDAHGALTAVRAWESALSSLAGSSAKLLAVGAITVGSAAINNLPVAALVARSLPGAHVAPHIAHAMLIAVDLGPNLAASSSLATLLWLHALRREGIEVNAWQFLRVGVCVVVPALLAAELAVR